MSASRHVLAGVLLIACSQLLAADEEMPDTDFLEYLGSWEESDEEWLIFEEAVAVETDKRSDPAPQGEESTETEDES